MYESGAALTTITFEQTNVQSAKPPLYEAVQGLYLAAVWGSVGCALCNRNFFLDSAVLL